MKLLFFSDVHGVASALELLIKQAEKLNPDKLVFLGDSLYHGPRNGVPNFYDSPRTAQIFNAHKNNIVAVRGNCDAEVDQMMLEFPIMSDFTQIISETGKFFITHGHLWNENRMPNIDKSTIFVHGHTHIPTLHKSAEGITIFNPGSISLPKCSIPPSFGFFDGANLCHYDLISMEKLSIG